MSECLVQSENLTAIANAIRLKAERSGNIIFPNEFISMINGIEKYKLPSIIKKLDAGMFTPTASDKNSYTMTHTLGEVPNFVAYVVDVDNPKLTTYGTFAWCGFGVVQPCMTGGQSQLTGTLLSAHSNSSYLVGMLQDIYAFGDNDDVIIRNYHSFKAGVPVRWIAGVINV